MYTEKHDEKNTCRDLRIHTETWRGCKRRDKEKTNMEIEAKTQ